MTALDQIRTHALQKKGATEDFPFDDSTLVIRVARRMFVLIATEKFPLEINLKCDPERAIEVREEYEAIVPGRHQNKRHWNTLILDGSIPSNIVAGMIDHSYSLVVAALPRATRMELQ